MRKYQVGYVLKAIIVVKAIIFIHYKNIVKKFMI